MSVNDLIEAEIQDNLDPLRHLRVEDDAIVPAQPPSTSRQVQSQTFGDIRMDLLVDAGPGCGGIAWPAGQVLSKYLVHKGSQYLQDRRVLELGSGTGLVGLVAAKLGAPQVIITDQLPLLQIMRQNVDLNALRESVEVQELDWGKELPPLSGINMVLAADCVYFEPAFPLLVQTLVDLAKVAGPGCEMLFCYKQRRKADKRFFSLLKKSFTWSDVEDGPERTYNREGISLLRLRAKEWQPL